MEKSSSGIDITKLKVLIVGSNESNALENYYFRYLNQFGAKVSLFPAARIFKTYYNKGLFNKVTFRAGLSTIFHKINAQFIETVKQYQPDVVFVFKGMEIFPGSLRWARKQGIKLVNYNADHPFIFSGKGSGNKNVTNSVSLYDLHLTYHLEVKEELEKRYHLATGLLPFGFEESEALYEECARQDEVLKLCFVGNPDNRRAPFIQALALNGISIDVFGSNWAAFLNHPNITIFQPVLDKEQYKVLRRYRVQLNLMRKHNDNSHNMRSFEVPGIGGIMVAPDTVEHRLYFEEGREIFLYRDVESCSAVTRKLLSLSFDDANEIRLAARRRSIHSGYGYQERCRQALDYIVSIL